MKKYLFTGICLLSLITSYPQGTKEISLENLYQKPIFGAEGFGGMTFLNDGKHYSDVDNSESGNQKIVRYHIASGMAMKTMVEQRDLLINGNRPNILFASYQFSANEKQVL